MNDSRATLIFRTGWASDLRNEERKWALLAKKCRYRRKPLVEQMKISSRTLERYFQRHLSKTVGTWLREVQLTDAYQQLIAGKSLKEVQFETGFKQASHFSRAFKKHFGIVPSLLRSTPQHASRASRLCGDGGRNPETLLGREIV